MSDYHLSNNSSAVSQTTLDAKEKRKQVLDQVRKRRAIMYKHFEEKKQKYYRVNTDFPQLDTP